jgi:hypothetical protein
MMYTILIGRWCYIIMHTQSEVKSDHSKSAPVSNWNMHSVPYVHHVKMLPDGFDAKVDRRHFQTDNREREFMLNQ